MLHISFISKPIMCKFYFLNLISGMQRSEVSRDSVCSIVLRVHFEALEPLLLLTDIRRQRWPEHWCSHWHRKTLEFCIPLIFVNEKCIMSKDGRFHVIMNQRFADIFFLKGICDINSHILFLCHCKSKMLRRNLVQCFWNGSTSHNLSVYQWFSTCVLWFLWGRMTLSYGVAYEIPCVSNIYIMVDNSNKITFMK